MVIPRLKLENISMRISSETKEYFEELFQESGSSSKGEFLKVLMDKYSDPESLDNSVIKKPEPEILEVEKVVEVEKIVEVEKQLKENEILITLNNLQKKLIEVITIHTGCRKKTNVEIENVNKGNDESFWGKELYSGAYKDLFTPYTCEDSPEHIKADMGAQLVNYLMAQISAGSLKHLGINKEYINSIRKQLSKEEPGQLQPNKNDLINEKA